MIDYERTNWWHIAFSLSGTVLPVILGRVGLLTGFSMALYLLEELVLKPADLWPSAKLDPIGHTVLGGALSLLIVFRTNTAYARFWEARSHWGSIVNNARNLVRMAAVCAGPADDLARLVAAYVLALKEGLRGNRDLSALSTLVPGRILDRLAKANNPASVLTLSLSEWVMARQTEGRLDSIQAMRLESLVGALVEAQGGCEKIKRTPVPFVYAALIKQVLLLYLFTLPFVLLPLLGVIGPLVEAVVALGMLGIEEGGVEIEDPFGLEPNNLPLERICENIARDTADLATTGRGEA